MKYLMALLITTAVMFALCDDALSLNIPITVKEALPANVASGWDRTEETVRLGVPLMEGAGISSIDQLAVRGATDFQFRVMETWPSGNIKWVLVEFPASVPANGSRSYALTNGAGQAAGSLAADHGDSIIVETGTMRATISKTSGNIIDRLTVGDVEYIAPGNSGGLHLGMGGAAYRSNYDNSDYHATIEENGPYRCCIKITGFLYNSAGTDFCMRYGMRMRFTKNGKRIRATLTLKNDVRAHMTPYEIDGFHWELETTLKDAPVFKMSGSRGDATGNVDERVVLIQGYSAFRSPDGDFDSFGDGPIKHRWIPRDGYAINKGDAVLSDFSGEEDHARGYADISDGAKKISLVYRQLSGFWSGGFELEPDGAHAITFMTMHKNGTYRFSYFAHETRNFILSFGEPESGEIMENHFNYPLFALAPFEQYRKTGAYWGETRLASYEEQKAFFKDHGDFPDFTLDAPDENNALYWTEEWSQVGPRRIGASSAGGPDGNLAHADIYLLNLLRSGIAGYYPLVDNIINAMCDSAVQHAHDYSLQEVIGNSNNSYSIATGDGGVTCNGIGAGYKTHIEIGHPHWLSVTPWYYITGDERIKDNWSHFVAHRELWRWLGDLDLINGETFTSEGGNSRVYTYETRDMAVTNFLFDRGAEEEADHLFNIQNAILAEASSDDHTRVGWDSRRGFWASGATSPAAARYIHSFFVMEKMAENLLLIDRLVKTTLPGSVDIHHKIRDRLVGLGYFIEREQYPWRDENDYRCWYDYSVDDDNHLYDGSYLYAYDYSTPLFYAFERTGDETFLETGRHIFAHLNAAEGFRSKPSVLRFIYDYIHKDEIGSGRPALQVVDNGGGGYTLAWTDPGVEVAEYTLKHSDKEIVDNLEFDNATRTWQYDPATHINFWSAEEPLNGPSPGDLTFTITGLDPGTSYHFDLKYITDSGSGDPVDECVYVGDDLKLSIVCAEYAGEKYGFTLQPYANPHDPSNPHWKMEPGSIKVGVHADHCPSVPDDLSLPISCAEYAGAKYAFTLEFYPNPNDPLGLYWKLDLAAQGDGR